MLRSVKPDKPYEGFPLTAHPSGRWCKKIRGRLVYFGPWDDWQAALNKFLSERDDLYAGRKPRPAAQGDTLAYALDRFLSSKKLAEDAGEISHRSYLDYQSTCDRIAACIGTHRAIDDIGIDDLEKLRAALSKGKNGPLGPTTIRGELTRARMVFLYINEYLAKKNIAYRKPLRSPSKRAMRKVANERGPRMFSVEEIQAMLNAAGPHMKAMILLGINCGFGNHDCGMLPLAKIDLEKGWHDFWRPKTHNPRRCPLWAETVDALKASIEVRPKPASKEVAGLAFLTREGNCWSKEKGDNAVSAEFRDLLKSLGIYRTWVTGFYSLRRTFETIGATAGCQIGVDYIMGHCAASDDMAAVYRQKTFDSSLLKVSNHVRAWLFDGLKIE